LVRGHSGTLAQATALASDQDSLDLHGLAEIRDPREKLVMRSLRLDTHSDVARGKPLAQILQPSEQVVHARVQFLDLFRSLDRDANYPVA
jgi:hypothetical protein